MRRLLGWLLPGLLALGASTLDLSGEALAEERGVSLMSVRVGAADVSATADFYREAFGLVEAARVELEGGRLEVFLGFTGEPEVSPGEGVMLAVLGADAEARTDATIPLVLRTPNVAATYAAALAAGAQGIREPMEFGHSGTFIALVADPAGNRVELVQRSATRSEDETASGSVDSEVPFVRPDVAEFLEVLKANPRPKLTRAMLRMIRLVPEKRMKSRDDLPIGELGEIRTVSFSGPGGRIKTRLYDPRPAEERDVGPVVVFYHGGAYVVGSIVTHEGLAAEIARALDLPVISVDYRLAPENPWPAAVDDGEAAARWIAENGAEYGRSFTGLVLAGDSAGGNLTLVTGLALRDAPAKLPVLMQLPIYPATDRAGNYLSGRHFRTGYGLDPMEEDLYQADPDSWRGSPIRADLAGSPSTLLVTASLDPLRDQGRAYAAKLVESGVTTIYYEARGTIHGFAGYRKSIPSAQRDVAEFLALAKTMLASLEHE